jgi:uncharacterized protein DUF2510
MSDALTQDAAAGWYEEDQGLRYWDGTSWTAQRAPRPLKPLTQREIASAVMLGVLGALFIVWLGAQLAPDTFYLPVKFVVKELPNL